MNVSDELHVSNDQQPVSSRIGRMLVRSGPNDWKLRYVCNNTVIAELDITLFDPNGGQVVSSDMNFVMSSIRRELLGLVTAPAGALNDLPPPPRPMGGRG